MRPERLIAIGDIHGETGKLGRLLVAVSPTSTDQLVFLGDYIDRGEQSREVIDQLLQIRNKYPHSVFLRGNHEQMLLDLLVEVGVRSVPRLYDVSDSFRNRVSDSPLDQYLGNGGDATLRSYQIQNLSAGLPADHLAFIESTRLWWSYQNFIFVHAGLTPDVPMENQDPGILLWSRKSPAGKNGQIHVVGHRVMADGQPCFEPGRYSLDTGATLGQALTACDVLTKQYWQSI